MRLPGTRTTDVVIIDRNEKLSKIARVKPDITRPAYLAKHQKCRGLALRNSRNHRHTVYDEGSIKTINRVSGTQAAICYTIHLTVKRVCRHGRNHENRHNKRGAGQDHQQ